MSMKYTAADKRVGALPLFPHHVEHLAPLCSLLGGTLLVANDETENVARTCYPAMNISRIQTLSETWSGALLEPTFRSVLKDYDILLYSHLLTRDDLKIFAGGLRESPPRIIFCPHGFSEKKQTWAAGAVLQDISLFYGTLALDQLMEWGVAEHLGSHLLIGDIRRPYYSEHNDFFARLLQDRGIEKSSDYEKTILYAPTWNDRLGSSSLCQAIQPLIEHLPSSWRLLIKPHPLLEADQVALPNAIPANVKIVEHMPLTHAFLDLADVYVGDMSALAYDYLVYDRPMVFLNQTEGTNWDAADTFLFQCGPVVSPRCYSEIYAAIGTAVAEDSSFAARRRDLHRRVYSPPMLPMVLKDQITRLSSTPAPTWLS
jgi:Putative glycosyl/glycerophosphate transferases involved in teichoic acid biosynthesis TagF/TagB/EpsJ/RodC